MYSRRQFLATVVAGTTVFSLRAVAQDGVKQVSIIVSFPAGGATDILARLIADGLRRSYAPTIVVENRPGAGGRIGTEYVKNGKNDGSVLLFTPAFPMLIFPQVYKNLPYDTLRDFVPVGIGARGGALALSIGPAVPASVKTVADFVQWCKENPKRAVFGGLLDPGNILPARCSPAQPALCSTWFPTRAARRKFRIFWADIFRRASIRSPRPCRTRRPRSCACLRRPVPGARLLFPTCRRCWNWVTRMC